VGLRQLPNHLRVEYLKLLAHLPTNTAPLMCTTIIVHTGKQALTPN